MAVEMKKKFVGPDGQIFTVNEVIDFAGNLVVYYKKESTGEKYSCLIDAFSERFKPVEDSQ